jgi:hypothetical protein
MFKKTIQMKKMIGTKTFGMTFWICIIIKQLWKNCMRNIKTNMHYQNSWHQILEYWENSQSVTKTKITKTSSSLATFA